MDKGDRVRIIAGKSDGQHGEIFWKGPNKYGPGERFGVRGDDGATHWVLETEVESDGAPAPERPTAEHTFSKGDRVRYEQGGTVGHGPVFWTGDSRAGGQRLGVKAESDGETVWVDAAYCKPAKGDAPSAPPPVRSELPEPVIAPLSEGEQPPFAPIDDSLVEQWAEEVEPDDGYIG